MAARHAGEPGAGALSAATSRQPKTELSPSFAPHGYPRAMPPFLGLRTIAYAAPDLAVAKAWYAQVLGIAPYFDEPFYAGFSVGGYELGLNPDTGEMQPGAGGTTAYWGVADCRAEFTRLLGLGARAHQEPRDVGGGILVASVLDPFGNVFGVIENPHFTAGG